MNIASRIAKQIESTDNLVPKQQLGNVTPVADLQELTTTVNSIRTTLVPFVTSSRRSKVVGEAAFDICIKGIKDSLNELFNFFKDLEKEFSIYTWKTQKVKIYQHDFLLKQRLDQFTALFNPEEPREEKKKKTPHTIGPLISDTDGRAMWVQSFGDGTLMVPWNVFLTHLEAFTGLPLKDDEDSIKMLLDFSRDDHVSAYELGVFLKWFGPLKGACLRMLESLRGGLLCGFVPAVEANLLLEGKKDGTYLVRCSKTQPGSFAVTFVDNMNKIKHCLLYAVNPHGLTLKNPPTVYNSLKEFADAHTNKLKHPLGNKWTLKNKLPGFAYDGKINESNTTTNASVPTGPTAIVPSGTPEGLTVENTCVVCMDSPLQTVFLECGHLACCTECSGKLKLCPICRNPIARVVSIFRV